MQIKILPSLLAADFGALAAEARRAEAAGADALHLDIMDGHFVPNLSMGPDVVAMAKRNVSIPLNVHLMLSNPHDHIEAFIKAGADSVLIHIEAECDVPMVLKRIRDLDVRPGITLNPSTPAEAVFSVLDIVDEVLCMSVEPGYGGQSFDNSVLPKLQTLRDEATRRGNRELDLLVDGGIDSKTGVACAAHGANALIAGTYLYRSEDMQSEISQLREQATASFSA